MPVRWGVLGTGNIAHGFAEGLRRLEGAELVAVGSRTAETAAAFAERWTIPKRHPSYDALAADPDVDVIYVATPHSLHRDHTLLCLDAGKPVLCEKPLAVNATQAQEMIARARDRNLFLMEAMWTRFLPAFVTLREVLASGDLGEMRMVRAEFCFRNRWDPESRLFDPELAGGALLDVGIYTVSLASLVFRGPPQRIAGLAHLGSTGVDEQSGVVLGYAGGALAVLSSATRTAMPNEAVVAGSEGLVRIHHPFWSPRSLTVQIGERDVRSIRAPFQSPGYQYEAAEVARCLRAGRRESDLMPLDESLQILRTLDEIRAQWGLVYPME